MPDTNKSTLSRWEWRVRGRVLDLRDRGMIMGILNVTPDSFSDGGKFVDQGKALEHALAMVEQGAEIIDIGGESTRPGATPVAEADELERVIPVVKAIRQHSSVTALISVDTSKSRVAEAALDAGAEIINDVTGLRGDLRMLEVAAASDAGLVVMHMQGDPRTMQAAPQYGNVTNEVTAFFAERQETAIDAGIAPQRILFDPGIGFGKAVAHNLELLRSLENLTPEGRPTLLGVSRKSFIGKLLGSDAVEDRFWATVALTSYAREHGTRVFRVHDVAANAQALRMTEAILSATPTAPAPAIES